LVSVTQITFGDFMPGVSIGRESQADGRLKKKARQAAGFEER
jgi:hypothetical protein